MKIISPLTGSHDVILLETIKAETLIEAWEDSFQINIKEELKDYQEIYLYQCNETKLKFFIPSDIAGSEKLYEQLGKLDWYYMEKKWEHDMAIQDMNKGQKILEVGCGKGAFIKRLRQNEGLEAYGIELNASAVEEAQQNNLPVKQVNLYDLSEQEEKRFDVVCTFQVLEHIAEPKEFLEAMIKLIKDQGKLIISVPNHNSFIKYAQDNLCEMPPHHMTQWIPETFQKLSDFFPIRMTKILYEPLALYHVNWYISTYKYRYPKKSLKGLTSRIIYRIFQPVLQYCPPIRHRIIGHTMYVVFEKISQS